MDEQEQLLRYLQQHILRSGEELSPENLEKPVDSIIDISLVKRTARTYRQVGVLTLAADMHLGRDISVPDPDLLKWTPGRRAALIDETKAFEWLSAGWIIKEMRLKRYGKRSTRFATGWVIAYFLYC